MFRGLEPRMGRGGKGDVQRGATCTAGKTGLAESAPLKRLNSVLPAVMGSIRWIAVNMSCIS